MAVKESEKFIRELLDMVEIQVNGPNPWDIQVHDPEFYDRVVSQVYLGLGEAYLDHLWDCEAIDQFVDRALKADLDKKINGSWRLKWLLVQSKLFNRQSSAKAYEVGEKHYDLGNDLYCAMLDKRLNYTCAYWKNASNLDEAQEAKLDMVCRKIGLQPGMHVLELGCGWGAFAKFAAEKYGAHVLGVTVSKEQVALGMELCRGLPVELRLQDYREVEGKYDRVISIGIMEHVGYKNYRTYMKTADRCLREDGIAFVHTIGSNESLVAADPWSDKYIFPNGMLPSIAQLSKAMEGIFVMEDWHNIGPNYDKTLMAWHANFERAWPELKQRYSERFYRMWRFYLLTSAGAFRSRTQQLWQIVMTRKGTPQPDCRIS
ncbi:MAG TPA: cyclopropane fatty acyl phospholipid synthase [Anaerolineaceae bacterium]|nr:cyclopropane fatty acyl phospholipid synthase [Anaerolineaceae bacterium]